MIIKLPSKPQAILGYLVISILCASGIANAQTSDSLEFIYRDTFFNIYKISKHIEYISTDEPDLLTLDKNERDSLKIAPYEIRDSVTFTSNIWGRLRIKNEQDKIIRDFISFSYYVQNIEVYEERNGRLMKIGEIQEDRDKDKKSRYLHPSKKTIPITFLPSQQQVFYFKISPKDKVYKPLEDPVHLGQGKTYLNRLISNERFKYLFRATLGVLAILSLIMFFSFKEISFLYYFLLLSLITYTVGSSILFSVFLKPIQKVQLHLFNEIPVDYNDTLYYSILFFLAHLFIARQLQMKKHWRRMWKMFFINACIMFVLGLSLYVIFSGKVRSTASIIIETSFFLSFVPLTIVAIIGIIKGVLKKRIHAIVLMIALLVLIMAPVLVRVLPDFGLALSNASIGIFVLSGTLLFSLFHRIYSIQNERLNILIEKERSEALLFNILPEEVATELKEKGESQAKLIDEVTVLFSDFVEFTKKSSELSPDELVNELNICFKAFDQIMERYSIEKIKTIGDAYMAAGGLATNDVAESTKRVIQAALEMQEFMLARKAENENAGRPYFDMRLGIHTGPIVAGVVGVKKFQYDIWGDTVNTASRMESNSEKYKVNISEDTYEILKEMPEFNFEPRGKLKAKGKGEMEMYFVSKS